MKKEKLIIGKTYTLKIDKRNLFEFVGISKNNAFVFKAIDDYAKKFWILYSHDSLEDPTIRTDNFGIGIISCIIPVITHKTIKSEKLDREEIQLEIDLAYYEKTAKKYENLAEKVREKLAMLQAGGK